MLRLFFGLVLLAQVALVADVQAQKAPLRDEFYWLGQMNKATAIINTDEGLLDRTKTSKIAAGIVNVLENGLKPGARRPSSVITFEPLLIEAAGPDVTLLHAGRSSQDMHATYRAAILREDLLALAEMLNTTTLNLVKLAEKHSETIVPNYTNGVAAQPNSLGHYLLGIVAGLERDAQRIREAYKRIDRSAMGTTVLNGSSWPLNRQRMADYLGFAALVDNAYDASQISSAEHPIEVGAVVTSIALHVGNFIEDIMTQYAQSRPWILIEEGGGNTYASSAMPQKRNPGILNNVRRDASTAISLAMGAVLRQHNVPIGMSDAKEVRHNSDMVKSATFVLRDLNKIVTSLVISPERALEELNSDWTASQELADVLMRKYKLPFRLGHHFASDIVSHAKQHNIKPLDFPYAQAKVIYKKAVADYGDSGELPMSEAEFRSTLDPVAIIQNRATAGGPQPAEMARMVILANGKIAEQASWIKGHRTRIDDALAKLDQDFGKLLTAAP